MTTKLVTPATALAVSLENVKANLRISGPRLDGVLEMWIRGVTAHAENHMKRSLMRQVWGVTLDQFPIVAGVPSAIQLRRSPVIDVVHVKFYDEANVLQTLDPADYELDDESEPGWIVLLPDKAWPSTRQRIRAVQVQYITGYGDTAASTPPAIQLYLQAKIEDMFDPRTGGMPPTVGKPYTVNYIDSMLDDYIIYD